MARRPYPWYRAARSAWFVTIDGQQHNLGPDKQDAFNSFYQLMREPRDRCLTVHSLATLADLFLEWVQRRRSAETYEWYRYRLERFVRKYPNLNAHDLRPYHVENWADEYQFSVTSRRNYLRSVKRCLKWAVKQGYLNRSPIENMEVPSAEHKEVVITQAEFDRLCGFVRSDALADLIAVTWDTGCRPQESLRVESRHVDLTNQRWVFPKQESKMKRIARVIYLTDRALAITRRRMLASPEGPLFRNAYGEPWTTEAVNCAFGAIQHRMGKEEMKRRGEEIADAAIEKAMCGLRPTRTVRGRTVAKTEAELRCEAKRKLVHKLAAELAPRYSLYALRHSWATNALQKRDRPVDSRDLDGPRGSVDVE